MAAFSIAQIIATMLRRVRGMDPAMPEWREAVRRALVSDYPGLWEALLSRQRQAWRYLVPRSLFGKALVLGDALGFDALAVARVASHACTVAEDAGAAEWIRWLAMTERVDNLDVTVRRADGWPYEGSRFDLVVLPDFGCDWGWRADLNATLRESHRVLVSGGCLYMTADNKLRRRSHGLNLATAGRRLRRTGFGATRWFAAFPSASLPKHLVDLHGNGVMDYYVSAYLNLDLRSGPMIRQANRFACRLGMASYLVPGYAMLGRKESE